MKTLVITIVAIIISLSVNAQGLMNKEAYHLASRVEEGSYLTGGEVILKDSLTIEINLNKGSEYLFTCSGEEGVMFGFLQKGEQTGLFSLTGDFSQAKITCSEDMTMQIVILNVSKEKRVSPIYLLHFLGKSSSNETTTVAIQ